MEQAKGIGDSGGGCWNGRLISWLTAGGNVELLEVVSSVGSVGGDLGGPIVGGSGCTGRG